jgi:hypothetical protein
MKAHLVFFCALLLAGSAFAQNYYMATQQAHRVVDQNNAEQARIQNAAAEPAPMDPALQATLQNINGLQANFAAFINTDGELDPTVKTALLSNLSQAAQGNKPAYASVKQLATDLYPALVQRKKIALVQQKKLAVDVHALFNSSHLSAAQQDTLSADAQKILTDAGVSTPDALNIVADLKKVADQTK